MEDGKPISPDDPDIQAKLRRHFQDSHQMNRLMDRLFGPGNWVFDPTEDVWVTRNSKGPGLIVVRRGGDWCVCDPERVS
jgi:hypothetical protein